LRLDIWGKLLCRSLVTEKGHSQCQYLPLWGATKSGRLALIGIAPSPLPWSIRPSAIPKKSARTVSPSTTLWPRLDEGRMRPPRRKMSEPSRLQEATKKKAKLVSGGVYVLRDDFVSIPDGDKAGNRHQHDLRVVILLSNQTVCNSIACPVVSVAPLPQS
jgi:hypothetical protein